MCPLKDLEMYISVVTSISQVSTHETSGRKAEFFCPDLQKMLMAEQRH